MLTNGRYGYFRDEFYYLAASDHLALGCVDFAPLMAWFTHASRFVFGDSLHAIRLLPAVAFGAEVLLTGFHHAGTRREALGHIARIRLGAARSGHPRQRHASFHESPRAAVLDGLHLFPVPRNQPATAKIAIVVLAPVSALVWIAGLGFLLFHRDGKRYRFLGVTYLVFLGRNDGAQGQGLLSGADISHAVRRWRSLVGEVDGAASAPALVACRLARRCVCAGPGCRTAGSPGSSASQDCSLHGRARHQANSDGNPHARPFAAILRGRIRMARDGRDRGRRL